MMSAENLPPVSRPESIETIVRHLREGEDLVRCAAARALGAIGDEAAAPVLVEALLDEDADVRVDAMAALVRCARPADADAIRRSLMGDPEKDVKVAAIEALSRLADGASVPLIRALAKDRCAHDVAWDDDAGMWDDWLDVQVAAIAALGDMNVSAAIDDLLDARSDEMGQELDPVVFAALARLSDGGVAALLGFLHDRSATVREQALRALAAARRDVLAPLKNALVQDASPEVRRLAIGCLDSDSPLVWHLALDDPDAGVRCAALRAFATSRHDIAQGALADGNEEVRAIAIEAITEESEAPVPKDLTANVQAWAETAGPALTAVCVALLPKLCADTAEALLCRIAASTDRPQEVRIAALRSLSGIASDGAVEALRAAAVDPVRQVRVVALGSLADILKSGNTSLRETARSALLGAMRGDLVDPERKPPSEDFAHEVGAGASKVEDEGTKRITISRDGEIVEADDEAPSNVIKGRFPTSTLGAMQMPSHDGAASDPGPEDDPRSAADRLTHRRRRVAVDGPADIGTDVRTIALRVAADCPGNEIGQALAEALDDAEPSIRTTAFEVVAKWANALPLPLEMVAILVRALDDPDAVIRGHASSALAAGDPDAADRLAALLDDPDAIVRANALRAVAGSNPDRLLAAFRDDSALVRRAALNAMFDVDRSSYLECAIDVCLRQGRSDTLAEVYARSPEARRLIFSALETDGLSSWQQQAALDCIASGG